MPFTTFKGERSVEDLVERVYRRLTKAQRQAAVDEILKANPRLANLRDIPVGATIRIPARAKLRTKLSSTTPDPDGEMLKRLSADLDTLSERIEARRKTAVRVLKAGVSQAKSAAFKRAIAKSDVVQAAAAQTQKTMAADLRAQTQLQTDWREVVRAIQGDIKARLEKG